MATMEKKEQKPKFSCKTEWHKDTGVSCSSLEVGQLKAWVSFPGFVLKHEFVLLYLWWLENNKMLQIRLKKNKGDMWIN